MDMDDLIAEGQRLFSQTKFDEAAAVFTKALEIDPDDVGLLVTGAFERLNNFISGFFG